VRDKQGRKMSKSLGNGLDPLELVDEFGADALKFTLAFMCAQGQDILVDKESFKMGSRFANKVWNASRYILMNLEGRELVQNPELLPVDRWIYSRLNSAAKAMEEAFLSYRYNDAAQTAYEYFWNDFCDWYVEATKLSMKGGASGNAAENAEEKNRAVTVLLDVLSESLKLLHPLLPFVTEEIYGKLQSSLKQHGSGGELLITAAYPAYDVARNDSAEEERFAFLQELVRMVRTLRAECTITPDKKLRVTVRAAGDQTEVLRKNEDLVKLLAGIGELAVEEENKTGEGIRPAGSICLVCSRFEIFVFIAEAVDTMSLMQKFKKDLEKDQKFIQSLRTKLANEQFIKNAPPGLVAGEQAKLEEALKRTGKTEMYLKELA
jgi:valyl-tRNA synthetase